MEGEGEIVRCAQDDDETRLRLEVDDQLVEGETVGYGTRGRERRDGQRRAFSSAWSKAAVPGVAAVTSKWIDLVGEAVGGWATDC